MALSFSDIKKINAKSFSGFAVRFWQKSHMFVFFAFLFVAVLLSAYIWHQNISGDAWSQDRKQAYLKSQINGVAFNENDYQKILTDIEARKNNTANMGPLKDIFLPYK